MHVEKEKVMVTGGEKRDENDRASDLVAMGPPPTLLAILATLNLFGTPELL